MKMTINMPFAGRTLVTLSAAIGIAMGVQAAPVMTDGFASRPVTSSSNASFTGDTTMASLEVGEPTHGGSRKRSVWGAWTSPGNGSVTMTTMGSAFDTVLAVYVGGSLGRLHPVAQNNNVQSGFDWSVVSFPVKSGTTYSIAVQGWPNNGGGDGHVELDIAYTPRDHPGAEVGTDRFADRPTLPSRELAVGVGSNRLAGIELDEPSRMGARNRTIWWRWVCPTNGLVTMDTFDSDFDTALTVYTGTALTSLTEVSINNDAPNIAQSRVTFQGMAGQEYQIMVNGYPNNSSGEGNVVLVLSLEPNFEPGGVVGSDGFWDRGILVGGRARGVANNRYFSLEVDEVSHGAGTGKTAWWEWTAPLDGTVAIRTEGSDFDTFLAVYTGSNVGGLELVASNNNVPNGHWSLVQFQARKNQTYMIMVTGYPNNASGIGNIALAVDQQVNLDSTLAIRPAVELELPGLEGVHYQLQSSSDLIRWENVGDPVFGRGQPIRILQSASAVRGKLYRFLTIP